MTSTRSSKPIKTPSQRKTSNTPARSPPQRKTSIPAKDAKLGMAYYSFQNHEMWEAALADAFYNVPKKDRTYTNVFKEAVKIYLQEGYVLEKSTPPPETKHFMDQIASDLIKWGGDVEKKLEEEAKKYDIAKPVLGIIHEGGNILSKFGHHSPNLTSILSNLGKMEGISVPEEAVAAEGAALPEELEVGVGVGAAAEAVALPEEVATVAIGAETVLLPEEIMSVSALVAAGEIVLLPEEIAAADVGIAAVGVLLI